MNALNVEKIAREELKNHGLHDWEFELDNSTSHLGICSYSNRRIRVSRLFASVNDEARMRNTILHEIAHALVGPSHGHDDVWRAKAVELGCDGERCADGAVSVQKKYIGTCPECGETVQLGRLTARMQAKGMCRACVVKARRAGDWDQRKFLFKWRLNEKFGQARITGAVAAPKIAPKPVSQKKFVKGIEVSYSVRDGRYIGTYVLNGRSIEVNAKTYESLVSSVSHKIKKEGGV